MNLQSAKAIAALLVALGETSFNRIKEVVFPLFDVLEEFASQGQKIVRGELFKDTHEWMVEVDFGSSRDGGSETLCSACDIPEVINPDYVYDCIGLCSDTPIGTSVTILAVGEVISSSEGSEEPPAPALGVDEVMAHALAMAKAIVENPYEDTSFSDRMHEYGANNDKDMLCGIRPRHDGWGKFNADAKIWNGAGEECKEAFRRLVMSSTGHPYAEAVQLRVKAGYMKVEDILKVEDI
jgi:hypothetical protein